MPKSGGKRTSRTRTTSKSETPTAGVNPDLIFQLRQIRWVMNSQRAKLSGMASMFDGRSKEGKEMKEMIREAQAHVAQTRDIVGRFLRQFSDEPLDDDLRD